MRYGYEGDVSISDLATERSLSIRQTSQEYKMFRPKAYEFRAPYLGRIADELAMEDSDTFSKSNATGRYVKQI